MSHEAPARTKPPWQALVLVCKDCKRRSKGPRHLKSKAVVAELKQALREERPRPRVVSTSCLGICPKNALAIAAVSGTGPASVVCVESLRDVSAAAPLLRRSADRGS